MDRSSHGRRDRLVKERIHDTYQVRAKLPEPTVCPECGVVYQKGRWTWKEAPEGANKAICPACRRIADQYPAGHIEIKGDFFADHRIEIINLMRNMEDKEKENHPMERIMAIEEQSDGALVTTTGIHLARGISTALSNAYCGDTSIVYLDADNIVKVNWTR